MKNNLKRFKNEGLKWDEIHILGTIEENWPKSKYW